MKHRIRTFLIFLTIFVSYMSIITFISNSNLFLSLVKQQFSILDILQIFFQTITGVFYNMSFIHALTLLLTATLVAINGAALFNVLQHMKSLGRIHILFNSGFLLGMITSGCSVCGIPILALLGLSSAVVFLPLRGYEFSIISILLLSYSLYVLRRTTETVITCKVSKKKYTKKR